MDNPQEIDIGFYRSNYPDLAALKDPELVDHFRQFGGAEGRLSSPHQHREGFLKLVSSKKISLEIGPFASPVTSGRNAKYFDILDTKALKARAKEIGIDPTKVPKIDFVEPNGDLSVIGRKFHSVVSSHCIEHQPDLVKHLTDVSSLLERGGAYYLLIPNKLYCFDHYVESTNIGDVLQASREKRKVHTLASVIEHRALTTHNDPLRHWKQEHHDAGWADNIAPRTEAAIKELDAAKGRYVDVHAWQFTPGSFRQIMVLLNQLGYCDLVPELVYETPFGRNEFAAILRKPG